jgi:hypothetical protein
MSRYIQAGRQGTQATVSVGVRDTPSDAFLAEGDSWKLIHRHADPLISEPEAKTKS